MTSTTGGSQGDSSSLQVELKYRMNHPERGRFIIFNNRTFKVIDKELEERSGTDVDSKNLKDLLEKVLQFDVIVHNDLTSGQMEQIISKEAERDHSNCDCFGVAVLTYEDREGVLYGTDCTITIERLLKPIKTCKSLYGKPKLCFIQACKPVEKTKTKVDADGPELKLQHIRLPLEADVLYAYSAVPGVYSWAECSDRGSWFIEALTYHLTRLAYEDMDLVRILTRVINQVVQLLSASKILDQKVPSISSMLTKDVYFTRKPASSS